MIRNNLGFGKRTVLVQKVFDEGMYAWLDLSASCDSISVP